MRCSGICRYAIRCKRELDTDGSRAGWDALNRGWWLCHDHGPQESFLREVELLERES